MLRPGQPAGNEADLDTPSRRYRRGQVGRVLRELEYSGASCIQDYRATTCRYVCARTQSWHPSMVREAPRRLRFPWSQGTADLRTFVSLRVLCGISAQRRSGPPARRTPHPRIGALDSGPDGLWPRCYEIESASKKLARARYQTAHTPALPVARLTACPMPQRLQHCPERNWSQF